MLRTARSARALSFMKPSYTRVTYEEDAPRMCGCGALSGSEPLARRWDGSS